MKLDLEAAGDEKAAEQLTGGLENLNQDLARRLALLLDSPNPKHLGAQKIDGVETQHYKGTLTLDEMVKPDKSLDTLSPKEREDLLAAMKKPGIKGYDTEVWVNGDGCPARMDVGIDSPQGAIDVSTTYSDYGAKAEVETPPASETVDLLEMLKGLKDLGGPEAEGDGSL